MSIVILVIAGVIALYMAWTIGANDVANAMGTSVGSRTLTIKQAILLASVFEFLGAALVGAWVSDTMRTKIVDPSAFSVEPNMFIAGMVASLLGAAIWVTLATYYGLPISTSHAVVGALMGFGLVAIYMGTIETGDVGFSKIGEIALSWLVSPFAAGGLAFLIFMYIKHRIIFAAKPIASAKGSIPVFVALTIFLLLVSVLIDSQKNLSIEMSPVTSIVLSLIPALAVMALSYVYLRGRHYESDGEEMVVVERLFGYLLVVTCSYVAFAHGANNVANAVGPVMAVVDMAGSGGIDNLYYILLLIGGIGLVLGISTWGYKVMETIGRKITEITPTSGFAATFSTATVTLVCTRFGYPTSVSQVMVGAIVGVGFAGGIRALDFKVIRNIVVSWVITVPIAAGLGALLYIIFLGLV